MGIPYNLHPSHPIHPIHLQVRWTTSVASSWPASATWKTSRRPWTRWTWTSTRCGRAWTPPTPSSPRGNGWRPPWRRRFRPCGWILGISKRPWRTMTVTWDEWWMVRDGWWFIGIIYKNDKIRKHLVWAVSFLYVCYFLGVGVMIWQISHWVSFWMRILIHLVLVSVQMPVTPRWPEGNPVVLLMNCWWTIKIIRFCQNTSY